MMGIREALRRLGQGETERRIAQVKVSRKTVRRHRDRAAQQELPGSTLPPTAASAARPAARLPTVSPPLTLSEAE